MNCPSCNAEMEYEEIKWPCGIWYCECGKEYEGERYQIAPDDHEERIGEEINKIQEPKEEIIYD